MKLNWTFLAYWRSETELNCVQFFPNTSYFSSGRNFPTSNFCLRSGVRYCKSLQRDQHSKLALEPSDYYRAMKSRGDHGATAGAVINLVWEKQLDFAKVKPVCIVSKASCKHAFSCLLSFCRRSQKCSALR